MGGSVKQLISLGLLGLMLVKAWVIPILYLDFEIRRDYIIANLCENRNRPQLHCDGKCYLAKRLAETRKQEERQAEKDYMAHLIYQVMNVGETHYLMPATPLEDLPVKLSFNYLAPSRTLLLADDIFHPPLV